MKRAIIALVILALAALVVPGCQEQGAALDWATCDHVAVGYRSPNPLEGVAGIDPDTQYRIEWQR